MVVVSDLMVNLGDFRDLGGVGPGEVPQDVAVDHQGAADHLNAAVDVHRWPPSLLSGTW